MITDLEMNLVHLHTSTVVIRVSSLSLTIHAAGPYYASLKNDPLLTATAVPFSRICVIAHDFGVLQTPLEGAILGSNIILDGGHHWNGFIMVWSILPRC